jgi:hypothetical protein
MKRITPIFFFLVLLFTACQKSASDKYLLKFYGDARQDIGYSVAIASDGYIIGGQMELVDHSLEYPTDSTNINMAIIKTNWDGNIRWKVCPGGKYDDYGMRVYQLQDGSVVCVGTLTDTIGTPAKKQIFAVKVSSSGSIIWKKSYGGEGNQVGKDIIATSFGFIILGSTDAPNLAGSDSTGNKAGNSDLLILKINTDGDYLDSHQAGFAGNDYPAAIRQDADGKFIVAGTTDREMQNTNMQLNNLFILRLTPGGENGPNRVIGTELDEYAKSLTVTPEGDYIIAGTVITGGEQHAYTVKVPNDIYSTVAVRNDFRIGNLPADINAIEPYGDGNYLLAGAVKTGTGYGMAICQIDRDLNLVAGRTMIKGGLGDEKAYDVVSGDDGYIIAVGSNTYDVNSMITLLKFKF